MGQIPWATLVDLPAGNLITQLTDTDRKITAEGLKNSSAKVLPKGTVIVSSRATIGRVAIARVDTATNQGFKNVIVLDTSKVIPDFLAYIITSLTEQLKNLATGGTFAEFSKGALSSVKIPLPSIEIQREIVAELDGYQKIIDAAQTIVKTYKPTIKINPEWEIKKLNYILDVRDGTHDSPKYKDEGYPLITSRNLKNGLIDFENVNLISRQDLENINKRSSVNDGDILMPMIGTIGGAVMVKKEKEFAVKNVALIKPKNNEVDLSYVCSVLNTEIVNGILQASATGGTQKFVSLKFIRELTIPVPPLVVQKQIVAELEAEQKIIDANKKLIEIYQQKIKSKIAEVWGD